MSFGRDAAEVSLSRIREQKKPGVIKKSGRD
jgi:hypothetical protein